MTNTTAPRKATLIVPGPDGEPITLNDVYMHGFEGVENGETLSLMNKKDFDDRNVHAIITVRTTDGMQIHFEDAVFEGMRDGHYVFSERTNTKAIAEGTAEAWKSYIIKAQDVTDIFFGADWDEARTILTGTLEDAGVYDAV